MVLPFVAMKRAQALELLASIAEDTSQPGYARVNALRALLDQLPDDDDRDSRSVTEARKLIRKLNNGDRSAA
jgi:hypothetical protein